MLLFFEIAALILMLLSAHVFSFGPSRGLRGAGILETSGGLDFNFLKFFIFFLWLSVCATFFFF